MGQVAERLLSAEEYLRWERRQPGKHEYVHGAAVAMAGATIAHNKIVANVLRALGNALVDRPCSVLASDTRVHIPASGNYRYPDASVACDPIQREDGELDTLLNPSVLVEVLSENTEAMDRGPKFREYRSIPSFRDYLLVDQNEPLVEHYVRQDSGLWTYRDAGPDDRITLASCGVEIRVSELYLKVFQTAVPG
jgi:Uma2 family endonuclease